MANVSTYMVLHVWEKASSVAGYDPDIWLKDFAGAWIRKDSCGLHTKYGWEVDHLQPLSKGGTNDLGNLAPLHWQNNQTKGADYPIFNTSVVHSAANKNRKVQDSRKKEH